MPKRKQEWHGRCEFPLTSTYERGHEATFGVKADRHCEGCGRVRHWCECYAQKVGERIFCEQPKDPLVESVEP